MSEVTSLELGRAVREICACAEQRIFRTCLRRRRRGYDGGTQWVNAKNTQNRPTINFSIDLHLGTRSIKETAHSFARRELTEEKPENKAKSR
jgi:hypothetical protein